MDRAFSGALDELIAYYNLGGAPCDSVPFLDDPRGSPYRLDAQRRTAELCYGVARGEPNRCDEHRTCRPGTVHLCIFSDSLFRQALAREAVPILVAKEVGPLRMGLLDLTRADNIGGTASRMITRSSQGWSYVAAAPHDS